MRYDSFDDVLSHLRKSNRTAHLLLGNGFSMSYDPNIFSYNALYDFIGSLNDEILSKLLDAVKTKNFELIMQQIDTTIALLNAFDADQALQLKLSSASAKLKSSLLDAIKSLHPEHVFKVPNEKSIACSNFLKKFLNNNGNIFTTNYDLLLYWVLMRQQVDNAIDGFGREILNPVEATSGEEPEWSDLTWGPNKSKQNIHYVHGALPLFDTGIDVIKEEYSDEGYLLENISKRLDGGHYPIFVTAGNGEEKLTHIRHNSYLSHCYDELANVNGSLITFGFGFGDYDTHIIDAINKAAHKGSNQPPKLWSIYIGTYSESDEKRINEISNRFHTKVNTFDARTVNVWG